MGIFRRNEPSKELNTTTGGFVIRTETDSVVREPCWFCGGEVEVDARSPSAQVAEMTIEPFGPGEAYHSMCHVECAERAKGSLER